MSSTISNIVKKFGDVGLDHDDTEKREVTETDIVKKISTTGSIADDVVQAASDIILHKFCRHEESQKICFLNTENARVLWAEKCTALVTDDTNDKRDPLLVAALIILAYCHWCSESITMVVSILHKAIKLRSSEWRLWRMLSITGYANGCYGNYDALVQAERHSPNDFETWCLAPEIAISLERWGRYEDAEKRLVTMLELYEEMSPRVPEKVRLLAVDSEYLLVHLLLKKSHVQEAITSFRSAEAKFYKLMKREDTTSSHWYYRTQVMARMSNLLESPPLTALCSHCYEQVQHSKLCNACKCVIYCSRECQVADWKEGHKEFCTSCKGDLEWDKQVLRWTETKHRWVWRDAATLGPFVVELTPNLLWDRAIKLKCAGDPTKATFYFGMAILMDETLALQCTDEDLRIVSDAVRAVPHSKSANKNADLVCLAMSILLPLDYPVLSTACVQTVMKVARRTGVENYRKPDLVENVDELNRQQLGFAMCHVFAARWLSEYAAFENPVFLYIDAFRKVNINRWPCLQLELGVLCLKQGSIDNAKYWLHRARSELIEYQHSPYCRNLICRADSALTRISRFESTSKEDLLGKLEKHKKQEESKRRDRKAQRASDNSLMHRNPRVVSAVRQWRSMQDGGISNQENKEDD